MRIVTFALSVLLLAGTAQAQPAALPDLSADVHMLKQDGQTFAQGKIYMSKIGARMEMSMPSAPMPMVNINRLDKNVMWMLMPNKTYMEQPLPFDPLTRHDLPKGWTQNCAPGEAIDGHPTEKCAISGDLSGKKVSTTIWKARDLGDVVIRNIGESGAGMELKNIVVAPQPPALFDVPADYKKADMSAMMNQMHQMQKAQKPK
jgi:uncharacterized protein DUF4412